MVRSMLRPEGGGVVAVLQPVILTARRMRSQTSLTAAENHAPTIDTSAQIDYESGPLASSSSGSLASSGCIRGNSPAAQRSYHGLL